MRHAPSTIESGLSALGYTMFGMGIAAWKLGFPQFGWFTVPAGLLIGCGFQYTTLKHRSKETLMNVGIYNVFKEGGEPLLPVSLKQEDVEPEFMLCCGKFPTA